MRVSLFAVVRAGLGILLLMATSQLASSPVGAQAVPTATAPSNLGNITLAEAQTRREALFRQMIARPDDLDAAFEYAALSVRLGDLEAAVATLERMLIFAPGLPRLQLELGLLYYRLNAFHSARTYLEAAIAGDAPEPVRQRVAALLDRIDESEDRDEFDAQTRFGIRYQTNANRAPEGVNVRLNGLPFTLNPGSTSDSDFNVYTASSLHYSKDLKSQGDSFDIDVVAYTSRQFDRDELNLAHGEVSIGPAFDLGRFDIDDAKLGVFAIASAIALDDDLYSHAFGAGTRFVAQLQPKTNLLAFAEYRRRIFHDTDNLPLASNRTGNHYRAGARVTHIISPALLMRVGVSGTTVTAKSDFLAYDEVSVWGGPTISFQSPVPALEKPWIASFAAGAVWREYDAPDPIVNAVQEQDDRELYARASLLVPFNTGDWSALFETEYRDVSSNYDTRDHDNFSVSFSIVKRW